MERCNEGVLPKRFDDVDIAKTSLCCGRYEGHQGLDRHGYEQAEQEIELRGIADLSRPAGSGRFTGRAPNRT